MKLKLVIGNKIYSTWSLRPWFWKSPLYDLQKDKDMGFFINL